jgi:hypothetical protein
MTHCRSASEKPREACADGSAMFMTVASSAIISCASDTNTSPAQGRCRGCVWLLILVAPIFKSL